MLEALSWRLDGSEKSSGRVQTWQRQGCVGSETRVGNKGL